MSVQRQLTSLSQYLSLSLSLITFNILSKCFYNLQELYQVWKQLLNKLEFFLSYIMINWRENRNFSHLHNFFSQFREAEKTL